LTSGQKYSFLFINFYLVRLSNRHLEDSAKRFRLRRKRFVESWLGIDFVHTMAESPRLDLNYVVEILAWLLRAKLLLLPDTFRKLCCLVKSEETHQSNDPRQIFFIYSFMETPAFFYAVFLWFLLLSVTGYSIYVGFGPPSKELRDPFEDHED
jgi:PsbN protein